MLRLMISGRKTIPNFKLNLGK